MRVTTDLSLRILLEAIVLLTLVTVGLRITSYGTVRRALDVISRRNRGTIENRAKALDPELVVRHVAFAARLVPSENACLVRALCGQTILNRRGLPTSLRIGVRRCDGPRSVGRREGQRSVGECEGQGTIIAHAWLERPDGTVVGEWEDPTPYVELHPTEPTE